MKKHPQRHKSRREKMRPTRKAFRDLQLAFANALRQRDQALTKRDWWCREARGWSKEATKWRDIVEIARRIDLSEGRLAHLMGVRIDTADGLVCFDAFADDLGELKDALAAIEPRSPILSPLAA
jgi:hypothetical protein